MAKLLFSPAKINLGLKLVGRNAQNYHLLQSIFLPLNFGDSIEVSQSGKNQVLVEWEETAPIKSALPTEEENILSKLLLSLPTPWKIHVKKNIPLGAGLGGGSSNAGTVLRFFVSNGIFSKEEAYKIACALGADVPFFLNPTPSWVTGIGEECTPLSFSDETWEKLSVLLVLVPEHCDTRKIFSDYKNSALPFSKAESMPTSDIDIQGFIQSAKNDLQKIVAKQFSTIEEVLSLLCSTPNKFCSLSGTGSTCYALYSSQVDCEKNAKELSNSLRKLGCRTVIAKILHVV